MSDFFTFILSCLVGACMQPDPAVLAKAQGEALKVHVMREQAINEHLRDKYYGRSLSANYLSGRFAQNRHDWDYAAKLMKPVLKAHPNDPVLLNRAMVLSIGSGDIDNALDFAKALNEFESEKQNPLGNLLIALEFFKNGEYDNAQSFMQAHADGSLSEFIKPLLKSWAAAAQGELDTKGLYENTIHLYHAILIADYLEEKDYIKELLGHSMAAEGLSLQDIERIADVYAHIGEHETAIEIYNGLLAQWPENRILGNKLQAYKAALKTGENMKLLESVASPEEGLSKALYDMARLLFQERSDESARVFAHMAKYVTPHMTSAKLLLGFITARNNHYEDAIAYYSAIESDDPHYSEAIRMAADLMEDTGKIEQALYVLDKLTDKRDDVEAVIQTGDIHRRAEDFDKALATYNQAAAMLGPDIPKEYWQLLYVRGMTYERLGNWEAAEQDLLKALEFQPNHPSILNYLGYAWADQGVNLNQSLDYIRRAAALQPTDGYIIDSLGWVLFRMGRYEQAIPYLERAVELMPYDSVINDHLGDAYWQVGRKLEAQFQWERARNYSDDEELIAKIDEKLQYGLILIDEVQAAQNENASDMTDIDPFE